MRKLLFESVEMIHYQEAKLGDELTKAFDLIVNVINEHIFFTNSQLTNYFKDSQKVNIEDHISGIIKKHTNLKVEILLSSGIPGAIMVFPMNRNHTFLKESVRDNYYLKGEKKILKESQDQTGTVDLVNGKVEGIFTKYEHTLYLDMGILIKTYKLSAREVTAVVLHELGHAFTYYEYSNRLSTSNRILADLSENMHNDNSLKEKIYTFKELGGTLSLTNEETMDLYNSTDKYILGTKLFKIYIREIGHLRELSKYDETTSESLADNFAVRQGYALELVSGLDKLYKYSPEKSDIMLAIFLSSDFFVTTMFLPALIIVNIMFGGVANILVALLILNMLISIWVGSMTKYKDMTYDDLKQRFNRIRIGMIGMLKNTELEKSQVKTIIDNLNRIEEIMNEVNDVTTLREKIINLFTPSSRKILDDISRQQELEELGYNKLFVSAAKLKYGL